MMNRSPSFRKANHYLTLAALVVPVLGHISPTLAQSNQPIPTSKFEPGWYAGAALADVGIGSTGNTLPRAPGANDSSKFGGKLFGGYQVDEHFGVELGYLRASGLSKTYALNGGSITQQGNASGLYVAGTARIGITERWSLGAKLGLGRGQFDANNVLPAANSIAGGKTGVFMGLGAEYSITPKISAIASYDYFPKAGERLRVGGLSLGIKASF
jgi:OmpA-OmpF porin, OOP family